jgi:hypothetical protein
MTSLAYRTFKITPRTFQIRGTGEWTLDLVISHRTQLRSFSGAETFPTEHAAIEGCFALGRRIIDGVEPDLTVDDLM